MGDGSWGLVRSCVDRFRAGDPAAVLAAEGLAAAQLLAAASGDDEAVLRTLADFHYCRSRALPDGEGGPDLLDACYFYAPLYRGAPQSCPPELLNVMMALTADPAACYDHDARNALNDIGADFLAVTEQTGDTRGAEAACACLQAAATAASDDDSGRPTYLANLAMALLSRFEELGDRADIDAAVDAAQATVDRIQVTAPFTGTITEVDAQTGDLVSTGDSAFRIDDLSSIYVDLEVSEVDVASLKVGQKATLEFDAIANKTYTGEVTEISLVGSVSNGVVNYPVTVRITDADVNIRPGMTASVSIVIDQADNVLIVPNKAIHTSNGQRTVTVLSSDQQISVPVTVSLTGDSQSAVTSPQLKEGDVVVISGSTATTTSSSSQSSNNAAGNLGGLSGPPSGAGGPPSVP